MHLFLFGPPRLETDAGAPISLDTRKALALAAYLVVSRASHSRDSLATLLWPESDGARARGALRRTLSTLKKALGGRWLAVDGEKVALRTDADLQIDVALFQATLAGCRTHGHPPDQACPLCAVALRQAVSLYTADFLSGFSLKDSVEFDDWQFFQAESLRREYLSALDRLVQWESDRRQWAAAIEYARRRLAADTLHEPAHRQLMRLYALAGQRSAALRQYRECVRVLDAELGAPPLDETTALYAAIQANELPAPGILPAARPPTDLSIPPRVDLRLPLVGRDESWRQIQSLWRQSNQGGLIAVTGDAGMGKSRLLDELLAYARGQGAATALARCFPGEGGLAYGVLLDAVGPLLAAEEGQRRAAALPAWQQSEIARLFPALLRDAGHFPPAPPLESPGGQARFFHALADLLAALLRGAAPGVLAFDDLHWADSATLDLLSWLARRLQKQPFCLTLAWRSGESDQEHLLHQLVHAAQRTGQGILLTLDRLALADVEKLLRVTPATRQMNATLAGRLYTETEGIPFLLAEQIAALADAPQTATEEVHLAPASVRELFASRLERLDGMAAQVISAAAVIGRSFDLETVQAAAGRSEEETVQGLEALLQRRLVVEQGSEAVGGLPRYDFCHEKLRELVYSETTLARRRLLHRRVAESLGRRVGRLLGAAAQAAYHYRWAGEEEEAAWLYALAGDEARSLYANAEALSHYRTALALGHPQPSRWQRAIGELLTLRGEYGAALLALEQAAAGASGAELAAVEERIGGVYQRQGEWLLAEAHYRAGLAALEPEADPTLRVRLLSARSHTAHRRDDAPGAWALAGEAQAAAAAVQDARARAEVLNLLGLLARHRGDAAIAVGHLQASLEAACSLAEPSAEIAARNNLALALADQGELAAAEEHLLTALERCRAWGDRHREAAIHNNLADLLHRAGEEEQSMFHLKQAVALFAEIGEPAGPPRNARIWKLTAW